MGKYQGKYQAPRPKRRPFLYLGLGCALFALLAAVYVGFFFLTAAQRKEASRQTAMEYVTPVPQPTVPTPKAHRPRHLRGACTQREMRNVDTRYEI